jgi:hypothetical protein
MVGQVDEEREVPGQIFAARLQPRRLDAAVGPNLDVTCQRVIWPTRVFSTVKFTWKSGVIESIAIRRWHIGLVALTGTYPGHVNMTPSGVSRPYPALRYAVRG